jgi:hypothetical protein
MLPSSIQAQIPRSIYAEALDIAHGLSLSDAHISPLDVSGRRVEMLFAHLKRILKLDRLCLRGWKGAREEFLLAATAQNFRKPAKLMQPR